MIIGTDGRQFDCQTLVHLTVEGAIPALAPAVGQQRTIIAMAIGVAPGSDLPALPALADLTLPTRANYRQARFRPLAR